MSANKPVTKSLAIATLLATAFAGSAQATIIDFEILTGSINCGDTAGNPANGANSCSSYNRLLQSYGDVAGVVDVKYTDVYAEQQSGSPASLKIWSTGYSDLNGAIWSGKSDRNGQSHAQIFLLPEAGYDIALNSVTFGAYRGGLSPNISILDAASLSAVFDFGSSPISTGTSSKLLTNLGPSNTGYVIDWFDSAYNVGVGAIDYTASLSGPQPPSPVSEPGVLALLVAGTIGIAIARRKKKST